MRAHGNCDITSQQDGSVATAPQQVLPLTTSKRTFHRIREASKHPTRSSIQQQASRSDSSSTTSAAQEAGSSPPYSYLLPRQALALFASGAVLGPFCDELHSQHDVLHYVEPSVQLQLQLGGVHWSFETCWWVPLLFGVAGLILGLSVPLLDELKAQRGGEQQQQLLGAAAASPLVPSWPAVLLCIALFVSQYGLSGVLEQPTLGQALPGTPIPTLDTLLFTYTLLHWTIFDKTPQGFGMAALTAVCGPAVEMLLINELGLYHYSHPMVLGVPTWIPWVYFCGGPAVGNLGRRVWSQLQSSS